MRLTEAGRAFLSGARRTLADAERAAEDARRAAAGELAAELEHAPIRTERLVALLPDSHPLAREEAIPLVALADEQFVVFPREIAPRLHDAFMAIFRRAGFEPRTRSESFHAGWDLGLLAELPAAAMVPQTVAGALPDGIAAVALSEPTDALETSVVWRGDDASPVVAAFVAVARSAFGAVGGAL